MLSLKTFETAQQQKESSVEQVSLMNWNKGHKISWALIHNPHVQFATWLSHAAHYQLVTQLKDHMTDCGKMCREVCHPRPALPALVLPNHTITMHMHRHCIGPHPSYLGRSSKVCLTTLWSHHMWHLGLNSSSLNSIGKVPRTWE